MSDEPKTPPSETGDAKDARTSSADDKSPVSASASEDAGTLPPPPDRDLPRPTPESQAALTGKAPSGSSVSGTTVPASSGETETISAAPTSKPKPSNAPPANETPEEKKARLERIIAEAKAKKEAAAAAQAEGGETKAAAGGEAATISAAGPPDSSAQPPGGKSPDVGDPAKSPSQADLERAAKIAEAKARAAALKESAAAKTPSMPGAAKTTTTPAAGAAAGDDGLESVSSVWPAANWMEREVFDLFGVSFKNHPDMRRLLLPSDWDGHPLRKDYPLEFMENEWTTRHLPEFSEVQREQLEQRRACGLEILQTPDERRIRELFLDGRDPLPKEHK